jgi:hypothetical protein
VKGTSEVKAAGEIMTPRDKEPVLLVLNYGASIKNFLMNEELWRYLTETYHVDVVSDGTIENPQENGIRRSFQFHSESGFLGKLLRRVDLYFINRLFMIHYAPLLLDTGFAFLYGEIHRAWLVTDPERSRHLMWAGFGKSAFFKRFRKDCSSFPRFAPRWMPFLKESRYKFVLISNFIEPLSFPVARYAAQKGIPVFASIMGIDNVSTGGPFMAAPDLLFLWGREQAEEFEQIQKRYNPELSSTRVHLCGNLIYDQYLRLSREMDCREELARRYGIPKDHEIILFPAYVEYLWPHQDLLCRKILEFIRKHGLHVHLLVRVRPGMDEQMWKKLEAEFKGEITVQIPGSAYDKSNQCPVFSSGAAAEDVREFVAAFRSASILVLPSFSSTVIDASFFGVPSFVAAFGYGGNTNAQDEMRNFEAVKLYYPHRADYNVFLREDDLFGALYSFFVENKREGFVSTRLFETIAYSRDGNAGRRYVDAIESYFR